MDNGANEAQMIQRIVLSGSVMVLKITGSGSMKIAKFLSAALDGEMSTEGEIKLKTLLKSGDELKVFSVRGTDNFRNFVKGAREYGIVYSVIERAPDENDNAYDYEIMVKAKDAAKINRVIEKYDLVSLSEEASISKESSGEVESVSRNEKKLEDVRVLMDKMLKPDLLSEQNINPVVTPERENLSGVYLDERAFTKTPNMPSEERSSVIEEIKDISEEISTGKDEGANILSRLLSSEDVSEEDKLKILNYNDQIQEIMNSVAEEMTGGEKVNV